MCFLCALEGEARPKVTETRFASPKGGYAPSLGGGISFIE